MNIGSIIHANDQANVAYLTEHNSFKNKLYSFSSIVTFDTTSNKVITVITKENVKFNIFILWLYLLARCIKHRWIIQNPLKNFYFFQIMFTSCYKLGSYPPSFKNFFCLTLHACVSCRYSDVTQVAWKCCWYCLQKT